MAGADIQQHFGGILSTSLVILCVSQTRQLDVLDVITPPTTPSPRRPRAQRTKSLPATVANRDASASSVLCIGGGPWFALTEMIIANRPVPRPMTGITSLEAQRKRATKGALRSSREWMLALRQTT